MSGATIRYPFPTNSGTLPPEPEGSKVVSAGINWASVLAGSGGYSTVVNLLSQFLTGQFTTVQSVFVDNATNIFPVSVTCGETQQKIVCAPFSQGMFPLIGSAAAQYTVTLGVVAYPAGNTLPPGSTTLFFLNTPQVPWEQQQIAGGTNFQSINGVISGWAATTQILPALPAAQHYAVSAFALTVMSGAASAVYATSAPLSLVLIDGSAVGFYLWRDGIYAPTTPGLIYSKQTQFPTPSMQFFAGNPLSLGVLTTGNSLTGGYPAAPGFYAVWEITYGVVTIQ
jgi:hypothetical protein